MSDKYKYKYSRRLYGDDYVRLCEIRDGFAEGKTGTGPLSEAVALLIAAELDRQHDEWMSRVGDEE